jgi:hypothetical protein
MNAKSITRYVAVASALATAAIAAAVVANFRSSPLWSPGVVRPPMWHAAAVIAPYVIITVLFSLREWPSGFACGLARGVALVAGTSMVLFLILALWGRPLVQAAVGYGLPADFMDAVRVAKHARLVLGKSGVVFLPVLLLLQIPLWWAAGRAAGGSAGGYMVGLATLALPALLVMDIQRIQHQAARRGSRRVQAKSEARPKVMQQGRARAKSRR